MKKVFALIEKKSAKFAQLSFFEFLVNKSIAFIQKLSFAAYFALFVMGYEDINKLFGLEEATVNPIEYRGFHSDAVQNIVRCRVTAVLYPYGCISRKREPLYIVNKQIREKKNHWIWFLKDLKYFDSKFFLNFSDYLKFNWSDQTVIFRQIIYELYRRSFQVNPIYRGRQQENCHLPAAFVDKIFEGFTTLYKFSMKLHIIFTPPNLPMLWGVAVGGGVLSMYLHKKFVVDMLVNYAEEYNIKQLLTRSFDGCDFAQLPCGKKATVGV